MSDPLKAALQQSADEAGRSLNAEIVQRLAASLLSQDGLDSATRALAAHASLVRRLAKDELEAVERLRERLAQVAPDDPLLTRYPKRRLVRPAEAFGPDEP